MVVCSRCGRTLDASETQASQVITAAGNAKVAWCADCVLKSPPNINSR
jgi:hypothetical protein